MPLPEVIDVSWRYDQLPYLSMVGFTMLSSVSIVFIVGIDPLFIYIYIAFESLLCFESLMIFTLWFFNVAMENHNVKYVNHNVYHLEIGHFP